VTPAPERRLVPEPLGLWVLPMQNLQVAVADTAGDDMQQHLVLLGNQFLLGKLHALIADDAGDRCAAGDAPRSGKRGANGTGLGPERHHGGRGAKRLDRRELLARISHQWHDKQAASCYNTCANNGL
jgi:hypothetical protein